MQSSANLSGGPEARRLADVPPALLAGADLVLDGGELPGVASTVLDLREYETHGALAHRARGAGRAGRGGAGAGSIHRARMTSAPAMLSRV